MISANDNKGYTSQQKSQIMEAIDILADHKLSASYVMGLYEKRTTKPEDLKRYLIFKNEAGITNLEGWTMGTDEEKHVISDHLEALAKFDLSPSCVAMFYESTVAGFPLKDC